MSAKDPMKIDDTIQLTKPDNIESILNEAEKVKSEDDLVDRLDSTARIILNYQSPEQQREEYENMADNLINVDDIQTTYDYSDEKGRTRIRKAGYTALSIIISAIVVALGVIIAIICIKWGA